MEPVEFLILGHGYLASAYQNYYGNRAQTSEVDITNINAVREAIETYRPKVIINTAAFTNTNQLEKVESHAQGYAVNSKAPAELLRLVHSFGIKLVHFSSGMIFEGLDKREDDLPDPHSYYAWTKLWGDLQIAPFPEVLLLRIQLPVSGQKHPKNLLQKLQNFQTLLDAQTSMTVVEDLLTATDQLLKQKATGIFHVVNPGTISFWEIGMLMKQEGLVAAEKNLTKIDKLAFDQTVAASEGAYQPTVTLNSDKLQAAGIVLPEIHQAISNCIRNLKI